MALWVLDRLEGEALGEIEPLLEAFGISYFDPEDGIHTIIEALAPAFAEREFRKKTAAIASFEKIRRMDREGLCKLADRFKRLERSMIAQGVARFDNEIRAHKLLETCRVSSHMRTTLLATPGHMYDFQRIEDAIKLF